MTRRFALRKQAGISQQELAFRASIDRTYISQIERGVGNPSLVSHLQDSPSAKGSHELVVSIKLRHIEIEVKSGIESHPRK